MSTNIDILNLNYGLIDDDVKFKLCIKCESIGSHELRYYADGLLGQVEFNDLPMNDRCWHIVLRVELATCNGNTIKPFDYKSVIIPATDLTVNIPFDDGFNQLANDLVCKFDIASLRNECKENLMDCLNALTEIKEEIE